MSNGVNTTWADAVGLLRGTENVDLGMVPSEALRPSDERHEALPVASVAIEGQERVVAIDLKTIATHGLVWGHPETGKTKLLRLLARAWMPETPTATRTLSVVDCTGGLVRALAIDAAATALALDERSRVEFARSFHVITLDAERFTPMDLYRVPPGMHASLLADLRAESMTFALDRHLPGLERYGLALLCRVAIALGLGVTTELAHALFGDEHARRTIADRLAANRDLHGVVGRIETMLSSDIRTALRRHVAVLTEHRPARVVFGLSSRAATSLMPGRSSERFSFQSFGQCPPPLALALTMNALVDRLNTALERKDALSELCIIEDAHDLVQNPFVASYLLGATSKLAGNGLSLIVCAPWLRCVFPSHLFHELARSVRWCAAFRCFSEDAALLRDYLPTERDVVATNLLGSLSWLGSDASSSGIWKAFENQMGWIPAHHFAFWSKGVSPFIVRTKAPVNLERARRFDLLTTFAEEIAARSMVWFHDAEKLIEDDIRQLTQGELAPAPDVPEAPRPVGVDALFAEIASRRKELS